LKNGLNDFGVAIVHVLHSSEQKDGLATSALWSWGHSPVTVVLTNFRGSCGSRPTGIDVPPVVIISFRFCGKGALGDVNYLTSGGSDFCYVINFLDL